MPLDYNDPQYLDAETKAVIKLLRDAAARAIKLMLNPPGKSEKTRAFNASWAAARLKGINAELDQVNGKLAKIATKKVMAAYQVGIDAAEQMARDAGVSAEGSALAGSFNLVDMRRAQVLAQQAVRDLTLAVRSIRDNTGKVVRKCQAIGIDNAGVDLLLAGGTIDGVPKATLRQLRIDIKTLAIEGKIITVNHETGAIRHFEPKFYADLVFRTKQAETATVALMERLQRRGLYYVKVIGSHSQNFCSAYVDKVFFIGPGDDPMGYPSNRDLPRGGPPFHPNCSKRFVAFIPSLATDQDKANARFDDMQLDHLRKTPADAPPSSNRPAASIQTSQTPPPDPGTFSPELRDEAQAWATRLNEIEATSIKRYQSKAPRSDAGYNDVNSYLRFKARPKRGQEWVDETISGLDSAISKGLLKSETRTFRAIRGTQELIDEWDRNAKMGIPWRESGYFSTSTSSDVAPEFWGKSKKPVMFSVTFPAGTPVAFPSAVTGKHREQSELLFARGSRFIIESVRVENGITFVIGRPT